PLSLSSHASRRRALHSFPTRRSSDLIGGPHRGRVLATAGIQMAVDAGERISCVVWNHRWRVHEYCASALHGIAVGRVRYVVFRGWLIVCVRSDGRASSWVCTITGMGGAV